MKLIFHSLKGSKARQFVDAIASLRIQVFYDYPYLYEGNLEYERKYLETYFRSENSFVFLVEDAGKIVGATTCILASEEEESFQTPLLKAGFDPKKTVYFGESLLLKKYRGLGIGKKFFEERLKFSKNLYGIEQVSFCAVIRENHQLEPKGYRPLDEFWKAQGFEKLEGVTTYYSWKDRGENSETQKPMQFWVRKISPKKD